MTHILSEAKDAGLVTG